MARKRKPAKGQKTVRFSDGRVVTFKSKLAADLARSGQRLTRKKKKPRSTCRQVRVCRDKKGRFAKQRKRK